MNSIVKKSLILGSVGFVIGILIGLTIFFFSSGGMSGPVDFSDLSVFELLLGGFFGTLSMGGTVVYDIESWSLVRATVSHFVPTLLGFYALGILQGWMRPGDQVFFITTVVFILIYIFIWLTQYLSWRRQIRQMNDDLRKSK